MQLHLFVNGDAQKRLGTLRITEYRRGRYCIFFINPAIENLTRLRHVTSQQETQVRVKVREILRNTFRCANKDGFDGWFHKQVFVSQYLHMQII